MAISPCEVEELFRASGAFLEGHFVLASGRHSPKYLEKFQVLQWPKQTERLCAAIVERVRDLGIDTVAGPTTGGVILAHEVARQHPSSGKAHTADIPLFALWEVSIDSYEPGSCPQCAAGEPIRKPGTTPMKDPMKEVRS